MKQFKDKNGKEWAIEITVGTIGHVKGLINVDLGKLHRVHQDPDSTLIDEIEVDTVLFGDVLLALVRATALTTEPDEKAFKGGLDGPAMLAAREAFWGELADFFQSNPAISALLKVRTELIRKMVEETKAMTAESIMKEMKASGDSSTSAPASSESTQDP